MSQDQRITNQWIRGRLSDPKRFILEVESQYRKDGHSLQIDNISPNVFFKGRDQSIIGWISEDEAPDELYVGFSGEGNWVLALCE